MNNKTTIGTSCNDILKGELLRGIYLEADGKTVKVYKKIAQLTNLGRTYFVNTKELMEKKRIVDANMLQKYGVEMYGENGLIRCNIGELVDLNMLNESWFGDKNTFDDFKTAKTELEKFAQKKARDLWWNTIGANWTELKKNLDAIKEPQGPTGEDNIKAWTNIEKIFNKHADVWQTGEGKELVDKLKKSWVKFGGKVNSAQKDNQKIKSLDDKDETPRPSLAVKISISTNFTNDWYTHKFKSGLLNKLLFYTKTVMRSNVPDNAKQHVKMAGHEYTQDEMLPQDKRKLDKIKWNMTNKVSKDYISQLLGWSREKTKRKIGENDEEPVQDLQRDEKFGKQMADKALGNRGLLGRLRQQLFAGGQKSGSIQVAFQMADMNDGWNLVDEEPGAEGGETGTSEPPGGEGSGDPETTNFLKKIGKEGMDSLMSLVERIKHLEDKVGSSEKATESTLKQMVEDAFAKELDI